MTVVSDESMSGILARCRAEEGLTAATLGELREALGYKKLGRWVLGEIADALTRSRLGYFPLWLLDPTKNEEPRQHQQLWIYDTTDRFRGQLIDAILRPELHDVRAVLDGVVGGRAESLSADQKIARIRQIIGD